MMQSVGYREAIVYLLVMVAAVDGSMNDSELHRIGEQVRTLPVFDGLDEERLPEIARNIGQLIAQDDGIQRAFRQIDQALPTRLHETAYALAVEVVAADGQANAAELRMLEILTDRFRLDSLVAAAIEKVTAIRQRTV